jgi:hypothetical protein
MSSKFEGIWEYSSGTTLYKYTFIGNTFKYEVDEGSGYAEYGNGTFSASDRRLILDYEQQYTGTELVNSYTEMEGTYGISDTDLIFAQFTGNTFVINGGNTETLVGKWNMYISIIQAISGGRKGYTIYSLEINLDFKSDGTFIISQDMPEESVSGKWVIDGDKLTLSECIYTPSSDNSLQTFFVNGDYTFKAIGTSIGFAPGYDSSLRIYVKK